MSEHPPEGCSLESRLAGYYTQLCHEDTKERARILDDFDALRHSSSAVVAASRPVGGRALSFWRWGVLAATLLVMLGSVRLFLPGPARRAYALEHVPQRLANVQSFRLRGHMWATGADKNAPRIRLPVDFAIDRPDRFRHTFHGLSLRGAEATVIHGERLCDGKRETLVQLSENSFATAPIDPLDAMLKTEAVAQGLTMMMLLGPPDARFGKQGEELVDGNRLHVYEGSFGDGVVSRVWLDPASGIPRRVVQEIIHADQSRELVLEIDQIEVDLDFEDSFFAFDPPENFEGTGKGVEAPSATTPRDQLDVQPTSAASAGSLRLETWHGFRIRDDAALVIWRRSVPDADQGRQADWLHSLELTYPAVEGPQPLQHRWVHKASSTEQWHWSLVRTENGRPLERQIVNLKIRKQHSQVSSAALALRFADTELAKLIAAAAEATLPPGTEPPDLESLRDWR